MTCAANQFGCSCTDTCQSATVPIIDLDARFAKRAEDRRQQSRHLVNMQLGLAIGLTIALVWIAFVTSAIPASKQTSLKEQEQVSWR